MATITSYVKEDVDFWRGEFELKQEFFSGLFPVETSSAFYRRLFPEGVLQTMDADDYANGKGNAFVYYQLGYLDYCEDSTKLGQKYQKEQITDEVFTRKMGELDAAYHIQDLLDGKITHEQVRKYGKDASGNEHVIFNWDLINDEHLQIRKNMDKPRAFITPVTYFGKRKDMRYAQDIYAIVLDIDLVSKAGAENLAYYITRPDFLKPTYIVNSGSGVHLYFVLDKPVRLHRSQDAVDKLSAMKRKIALGYWKYGDVSSKERIDAQSIYQSYAVVGSPTKFGTSHRVTAYKVGDVVSIETLFQFAEMGDSLPFKYNLTLAEAKEAYPNWVPASEKQNVDEDGNERGKSSKKTYKDYTNRKEFTHHRGVYDAELKRLHNQFLVTYGHRYWCLFCLGVTAVKCDIPREEFERDCWEIGHWMANTIERTKPFTDADIVSALKGYDDAYRAMSLDCINYKTAITREKNKRNWRTQDAHLKFARFIRDEINGKKDTWREGNGRPSAEQTVRAYLQEHPDAKKADVIRGTGLSKPTVYKWYDKLKEEKNV